MNSKEYKYEQPKCPTCERCYPEKELVGSIRGDPLYNNILVCKRLPASIKVSPTHFCAEHKVTVK